MDFTGVALGSGVNQYMKMDEMARANKKLEMEKAIQDQALEKGRMDLDQMRTVQNLGTKYRNINSALARGELDHPDVQGFVSNYNNNQGAFNNGYTMALGQDAKGGRSINFFDADGNLAHSEAYNPQNIQRMLGDAYRQELAFSSPDYYYKNYAMGQKDRELGTDEKYKLQVVPQIHAGDNATRLQAAQISAGPAYAQAAKGHYVPLTDGYSFDQGSGRTVDSNGRQVTDQATLARLHKLGAPGKAPVSPEDVKEYRKEMVALGPRPEPKAGLMGGVKNQSAIDAWDARAKQIREIYKVDAPESSTPKVVVRAAPEGGDPIAAKRAAQSQPRTQGLNLRQPPSVPYNAVVPPNIYDTPPD